MLNFIKFRRSVRQFTDERVAQKYLNEILESGRFTQTATNLQDVTYTVITQNIEILKQTCLETLHHMGNQILSEGSEKTSLIEKEYARYFIELYKAYKTDSKNDGLFYNAPAVIMVKSNINWSINGALASSNMELMANALGLGTFHCGLLIKAAEQNEMIGQLAGVKNGEQLVACMPVGHPAVKYFRTVPRQKPSVNWQ